MKIYHYDPKTGVYLVETDSIPDSAYPNNPMIPAHATAMAPPTVGAFQSAVFRNGAWQVMSDYTKYRLFDIQTHLESDNTLQLGDPLPNNLTTVNPGNLDYPKWNVTTNAWETDVDAKNADIFAKTQGQAAEHMEAALRMLEDNNQRKAVPNLRVMSQPDESAILRYVQEMQVYLDLLQSTGPNGIAAMNVPEPTLALSTPRHTLGPLSLDEIDETNIELFTQQNPGGNAATPSVAWQPNQRFNAGQLVYGTQGEGLFVVTRDMTSNPTITGDVADGTLVSAMPTATGLRYPPVQTLADLAGLNADDFAICKVVASGDEYVFHLGAAAGDVQDNNNTGYWIMSQSPNVGRFIAYHGTFAAVGDQVSIGVQPFTVVEMLVFVNGSLKQDSQYVFDAGTGVITFTPLLQVNDTWKVLVMS